MNNTVSPLFYLDYMIIAVYMVLILVTGLIVRRAKTPDEYFLGRSRLPWWAVGMSAAAVMISPISFIGAPNKIYATDWHLLWYGAGSLLVIPIVVRYYLPYFQHRQFRTAYEYLELRFNRTVRRIAAGLFVLFMITRIAIILVVPSLLLSMMLGMDITLCVIMIALMTMTYCILGGLETLIWVGVVQGLIFMVGIILPLILLVTSIDGGVRSFLTIGYESGKFNMYDFRFDVTRQCFWVVLLSGFFNELIVYLSDQNMIQRYRLATDTKQTAKSLWFYYLIGQPFNLILFLIGTALFVYYQQHPTTFQNDESVFPHFIVHCFPQGFTGLNVVIVLSLTMSTVAANISAACSALYIDFIEQWIPDIANRKYSLFVPQITGVVIGVLSTMIALFLVVHNGMLIWDQFNALLGLLVGPVGGLFFMGIFSRRINSTGAIVGLLAAFTICIFVANDGSLHFLTYGMIGMTLTYLIGYVVSCWIGGPAKMMEVSR